MQNAPQIDDLESEVNAFAQLQEAAREADLYAGTDPVAIFRAHSDFDFPDVMTGELLHDPDCPYCRVRRLKRAYALSLHFNKGSSPS